MFDSIMKKKQGKKNKQRLLDICSELIIQYEKDADGLTISCKEDLMEAIKSVLDKSTKEIENWRESEVNYIEMAHKLLAHLSFDLLASGKYHLYSGILNPMKCSDALRQVHDKSLDWAVNKKIITQEEMDNQISHLIECIDNVG